MTRSGADQAARGWSIRRVMQPGARLLAQVKDIYLEAFPPSQRGDFGKLAPAVRTGTRLLTCLTNGGMVLGFSITVPLSGLEIHYLEYLAVQAGQRGRGMGSALLQAVAREARAAGAAGLILEVEPGEDPAPDGAGTGHTGDDGGASRRRIAFYQRNGAHLLPDPPSYQAPDLSGEGWLEMRLMWMPLAAGEPDVAGARLEACIRQVYVEGYGVAPDDPHLRLWGGC